MLAEGSERRKMNKLLPGFLIIALSLLSLQSIAATHPELKAFPEAKEGMERFVIALPHKERGEDNQFKVELIPGKEMLTDGVNLVRLGVEMVAHPLKGWGYTYYEINGKGETMSTLMAVPDADIKIKQFVKGRSITINYNSRLPIVIYAAKGYQVRYRIWEAGIEKTVNKN